MSSFEHFVTSFGAVFQPHYLLWLLLGQLVGLVVGILPGVNASMGVAVLLPLAYAMDPLTALIFLVGIYFAAMTGGAITSILFGVPGTSTAAVVVFDGHELARQGRAGAALGLNAFASWVGGAIGLTVLALFGPFIARVALAFGPAEYFALVFFGLTFISALAAESPLKGLIAGALGLLAGTVGIDPVSGVERYTFGNIQLMDGIAFIPVLVGLFAVSQVLVNAESSLPVTARAGRLASAMLGRRDLSEGWRAMLRGSVLGTVVGILPGAGATVASFLSYAIEKAIAKRPWRFGKGAIEGLAGPAAADNAAASGALVPLLTMGIPGSETTAVLMGALMILGLRPGPLLFTRQADLVWTFIAAMYVALTAGAILAVVSTPWLIQVLRVPGPVLNSFILAMSFIGAYAVGNSMTDVWVMVAAGLVGYVMRKLGFPVAPVVLALVLGPMAEESLRQAMLASAGDVSVFLTSPIAAGLLLLAVVSLAFMVRLQLRLQVELLGRAERPM